MDEEKRLINKYMFENLIRKKKLAACSIVFAAGLFFMTACAAPDTSNTSDASDISDSMWSVPESICGLQHIGIMELKYAEQFSVEYYEDGCRLVTVAGTDVQRFFVVPEGTVVPGGLAQDTDGIVILEQPMQNIYLAATAVMDYFCSLDALGCVSLSGTKADGWYVDEAREAMERGEIRYAGKYSAPDYELILNSGCSFAIESTMVEHVPEVREKLEKLGIHVLVDRSSYESHPLGRTEWIKLYGVLSGRESEAEAVFDAQCSKLNQVLDEITDGDGKSTVAFFYITSAGAVNIRKSGDYISKMIELAGAEYIFDEYGDSDSASGTANIQMETFYAQAGDCDYLIYNSIVDAEPQDLSEFLSKSSLLADFKAVKNGNVFCTGRNMFQETSKTGQMILDIHNMVCDSSGDDSLVYLRRLK